MKQSITKVVVIDSHMGLQMAFSLLISNQILSAPVKDGGRFIGFLDIRDLVSFVLFAAKEHSKHAEDVSLDLLMSDENFFKPNHKVEQAKMFANPLQAITVSYLCRRHKFTAVSGQEKLINVLRLLATRELHRIPVEDNEGNLVAIISQSNIIDFLVKKLEQNNNDSLSMKLQQSILDAKIGHSPVFSAVATAPASLAFELMDNKQVFGLAVVNNEGALVGNISASDIKLFFQSPDFRILSLPLTDFLSSIRRRDVRTRVPAACEPGTASLASVVGKLAATKMHRLFVCDAERHPTLVISLTDVLATLLTP